MIVTNKKCFKSDFSVRIDKTPLENCDTYKYLGVMIDRNLNWKPHIEYISTKISKACGVLSKLRHSLSTGLLIEIYYALLHSYLRYGILTWGNASDATLKPLQILVNRALRIITFAPFGRIDLSPIYKELKLLDVKNTFYFETSKFMFKLKNELLPTTFANYFETSSVSSDHSYTLRSSVRRTHVFTRLLSSNKTIQIRGEKLWNEIPEDLRENISFNLFKKATKNMLIENY